MANHTGAHIHTTNELVREMEVPEFRATFEGLKINDAAVWEHHLVFGRYDIQEVLREVKNGRWQRERIRMLNTTHEFKWNVLKAYLEVCGFDRHSRCVVTNYVYALKRGGVIK